MPEVLFVAGEASGDLHAAGVAEQLRILRPELELVGVGGSSMHSAGVRLVERRDGLGVMGFTEVLRHLPAHYALLRKLSDRLETGSVRLLLVVDYPGFNMKLARVAKRAGVPVLYYITPQVWAWGAKRIPELASIATRAAVILPFEEKLLRGYGVSATFVGHPLLDRAQDIPDRRSARSLLGFDERPVLALFPGSRQQEVDRHLDVFVESAEVVARKIPDVRIVISASPGVRLPPVRAGHTVLTAPSLTLLRASDAALCKSGTTTLEAAIADCPLAIGYRAGRVSYLIARRLVTIPHIGLVNIVAGREVAREFLQHELQSATVAPELIQLLQSGSIERERVATGLAEVRKRLGTPGAARRVAEMAAEMAA